MAQGGVLEYLIHAVGIVPYCIIMTSCVQNQQWDGLVDNHSHEPIVYMYISTKPHKLDTHQFELIYCCIPVTKLEPECTSSLEHILQTQLPNFLHIITPHGKQGMKDAEWKISHALMDNYTKKVKVFVKDKWECSIINAFISKMPNLLGAT